MNVLAIGAHFDDVELGCGGSLAKHADNGDNVYVYVATKSGYKNQNQEIVRSNKIAIHEAKQAMKHLNVKQLICGNFTTLEIEFIDELNLEIIKLIENFNIDLVYTHWDGDIHHDHQALSKSSLHSCRHVKRLLMYRSNWYHSTKEFKSNFYIDITDYWSQKMKAILEHKSEMTRTNNKWLGFFRNEAENAGQRIGVKYAEVFEVVKWLQ